MNVDQIILQVTNLFRPIIEAAGMELVEVELAGSRRRRILRIFIDKPGGVSVEDCAQISRQVSDILDMEDPIEGRYVLEVSSPGLDREVKSEADYQRYRGRMVRVITSTPIEGTNVYIGRLMGFDGQSLWVDVGDKTIDIPLETISKARLEPEV